MGAGFFVIGASGRTFRNLRGMSQKPDIFPLHNPVGVDP